MQDGNSNIFIKIDSIKEASNIKKYINKYTCKKQSGAKKSLLVGA